MTTQIYSPEQIKLYPIGFAAVQQFYNMGASDVSCFPQEDGTLKVVGRVFDGRLSLNLQPDDWSV